MWRLAAAAVARYLPGLGDPMSLTYWELQEWSDAIGEILNREFGDGSASGGADDHRARVEAEMRRIHG